MKDLLVELKRFYKKEGRGHLPWRKTKDPYKILVSEVMLQQTQVGRVVPFYKNFIKQFPTPKKLAEAKLSDVLKAWQGLGYNRRAKYLHGVGIALAETRFPKTAGELEALSGVGPYTARAVAAFAYNRPEVFVETNIRTVLFYHGLVGTKKVSDTALFPLVAELLKKSKMQPRDFYAALMDYGSHLKQQGVRLNKQSKHYAKQSKFEGSARQLRGAILRELLQKPAPLSVLTKSFVKKFSPARSKGEIERELKRLEAEGMVVLQRGRFRIPY